jgi:hypothetical protein
MRLPAVPVTEADFTYSQTWAAKQGTNVDAMVEQARTKNYALREFIHALISSEAFHRK